MQQDLESSLIEHKLQQTKNTVDKLLRDLLNSKKLEIKTKFKNNDSQYLQAEKLQKKVDYSELQKKLDSHVINKEKGFRDISLNLLFEAIDYSLLSNGKRIRSFFVLEIGAVLQYYSQYTNKKNHQNQNKVYNNLLKMAVAVELIHSYSLVHDDLPAMDNDDYRRGILSCHRKYDESIAILVGDSLLTMAFQILSEIKPSFIAINAINILSKESGIYGMILGQIMDTRKQKSSYNHYYPCSNFEISQINELKTGSLFAISTLLPGLALNLSQYNLDLLYNIGQNFGLLYQIDDDSKDDGLIIEKQNVLNIYNTICTDIENLKKNMKFESIDKIDYLYDEKEFISLKSILNYFLKDLLKF